MFCDFVYGAGIDEVVCMIDVVRPAGACWTESMSDLAEAWLCGEGDLCYDANYDFIDSTEPNMINIEDMAFYLSEYYIAERDAAFAEEYYGYFAGELGSVAAVYSTEPNGIAERYSYDAYGSVSITDPNGQPLDESAVGNPYMFTGRRYDSESGLYYYRARYYNPKLGVFHSRDPLGYIDSMNLYAYCGNNPVNYFDPMGKDVWIARHYATGWHANLNVGNPNGRYKSFGYHQIGWGTSGSDEFLKNTFNPWAENFLTGEVYRDKCHKGGFVEKKLNTTSEEDEAISGWLDSIVGQRGNYFIIGANCHAWTNLMFNAIKNAYGKEEERMGNGMRAYIGVGIWL
ncbi:RHS repeat-associated core domain-containing protein [Sedimentisphaera salicampi]|uniref:RHS repeat-associated core domain-containing protein n=1 Tax=Sedimentisphaera salicampi TaxID=1941349 RepID=UPI000B9B1281|nr:RHS repeat-associated core domain-containing protein [Sedimentisphaera salicampi]OXU14819.1 putative cell wall-associated polypeptide [Sedimentisphaera salicampi]